MLAVLKQLIQIINNLIPKQYIEHNENIKQIIDIEESIFHHLLVLLVVQFLSPNNQITFQKQKTKKNQQTNKQQTTKHILAQKQHCDTISLCNM